MEMVYERPPEPLKRPTMLLKAVTLPRLRRDTMHVMKSEMKMALSGIGVPTVVIFLNQPLNGKPSSRAKAHAWRDPAARTERLPQIPRAQTIETMAIVPPVLPVAAAKTYIEKSVQAVAMKHAQLTSTYGKAAVDSTIWLRISVTQKQKVMIMTRPRTPFNMMVVIIMRGTTLAACRTSSARSTAH
jgi:hypothetical protein